VNGCPGEVVASARDFVTVTVLPDGSWTRTLHAAGGLKQTWLMKAVGRNIGSVAGLGWTAYRDDQARLKGLAHNPLAEEWMRGHGATLGPGDRVAGPVVFVGVPDAEGNETGLRSGVAASLLDWLSRAEPPSRPQSR
jgi:hypothetical protein